jgi:hypothetical protein
MPQAGHGSATVAHHDENATGGSGNATARGAAGWLCLAAAPTFALMALLTGVLGGGPQDMMCSAADDMLALRGMAVIYMLMCAFHAAPWVKLISDRQSGARRF